MPKDMQIFNNFSRYALRSCLVDESWVDSLNESEQIVYNLTLDPYYTWCFDWLRVVDFQNECLQNFPLSHIISYLVFLTSCQLQHIHSDAQDIICTNWLSGRAGWKNIWLVIMANRPNVARSIAWPNLVNKYFIMRLLNRFWKIQEVCCHLNGME